MRTSNARSTRSADRRRRSCCSCSRPTWANCIDPSVKADFEKETGIRVVEENFDSNESMRAKLKAGSGGYDLVTPSDYMVQQLAKAGLLGELDRAAIPKSAENREAAHKFINFLLRPDFGARIANFLRYASTIAAARPQIKPEILNDPGIYPTDETFRRLGWLKDLGDAEDALETVWTEVKAKREERQGMGNGGMGMGWDGDRDRDEATHGMGRGSWERERVKSPLPHPATHARTRALPHPDPHPPPIRSQAPAVFPQSSSPPFRPTILRTCAPASSKSSASRSTPSASRSASRSSSLSGSRGA